jgi:hypothetical protein
MLLRQNNMTLSTLLTILKTEGRDSEKLKKDGKFIFDTFTLLQAFDETANVEIEEAVTNDDGTIIPAKYTLKKEYKVTGSRIGTFYNLINQFDEYNEQTGTGLSVDELNNMYRMTELSQVVKGFQNVMGSMTRLNFQIATTEKKFGRQIETRLMANKDDTGREKTESTFVNVLIRRFSNYSSWADLEKAASNAKEDSFAKGMLQIYNYVTQPGDKTVVSKNTITIKNFLELAGLTSDDYQIADNMTAIGISDITFILSTIAEQLGKEEVNMANFEGEVASNIITIHEILLNTLNTKIPTFIDKIFRETNYAREKMMVAADGKKVVRDILATHLDKVMKQLMNFHKESYYDVESYLKTPMMLLNGFVNKSATYSNTIQRIFTYDAHRNENTGLVKVRKNENKAEYYRREFIGYFIDAISTAASSAPTYMQSFYDLEEREKMKAAQVKVLSKEATKDGLRAIIRQLKAHNKGLSQ